jgi:hypothetical protein
VCPKDDHCCFYPLNHTKAKHLWVRLNLLSSSDHKVSQKINGVQLDSFQFSLLPYEPLLIAVESLTFFKTFFFHVFSVKEIKTWQETQTWRKVSLDHKSFNCDWQLKWMILKKISHLLWLLTKVKDSRNQLLNP